MMLRFVILRKILDRCSGLQSEGLETLDVDCPELEREVKELPFAVLPIWYANAPDTDHWYYRMAEEKRPDGWAFYKPSGLDR